MPPFRQPIVSIYIWPYMSLKKWLSKLLYDQISLIGISPYTARHIKLDIRASANASAHFPHTLRDPYYGSNIYMLKKYLRKFQGIVAKQRIHGAKICYVIVMVESDERYIQFQEDKFTLLWFPKDMLFLWLSYPHGIRCACNQIDEVKLLAPVMKIWKSNFCIFWNNVPQPTWDWRYWRYPTVYASEVISNTGKQ